MFPVVGAAWLAPEIKRFELLAPRIARKQRPGQFVIVRVHERGERIPLTIADADVARGTISLIVQGVGKTTCLLNTLDIGDALLDVVGPLGNPSEIARYGSVAVIGGGVGTAIAFPTARALHAVGNDVLVIIGARNRELVILEAELRDACDELIVMTDDGSAGRKGLVTDALRERIENSSRAAGEARPLDYVLAIGPIPMMRAVAELTRPHRIRTMVSLNSIMIDGTGMCGGCRVVVGDQARFTCVDGPEFDAHQVDFVTLAQRNAMYRDAERRALDVCQLDDTERGNTDLARN